MPKLKVFFSRNVSAYQSKIKNTAFSLVDIEFLIELKPKKTLIFFSILHGLLRMPGEEIAFTAWPKINSHSQILRYDRAYFVCHIGPNFQILWIMLSLGVRSPWYSGRDFQRNDHSLKATLYRIWRSATSWTGL